MGTHDFKKGKVILCYRMSIKVIPKQNRLEKTGIFNPVLTLAPIAKISPLPTVSWPRSTLQPVC